MSEAKATALAERVASSALLMSVARVSMVIASVFGVPMALSMARSLWDISHRVSVIEDSRGAERLSVHSRLESLEAQNRTEAEIWRRVVERLAGLEATQQSMLRAMERMERGLERDRRGGSP